MLCYVYVMTCLYKIIREILCVCSFVQFHVKFDLMGVESNIDPEIVLEYKIIHRY